MPQYRFRWDVVPQPLLRRLADALELPGDAAPALAAAYGTRPRTPFVGHSWPILRDVWLHDDAVMRQWVVTELRRRGRGDPSLPTRTDAEQREYLRSCSNSPALREVVLAAFRALAAPGPRSTATPPNRRVAVLPEADIAPRTSDAFDESTEAAWAAFATVLEAELCVLTDGCVLLSLPGVSPIDRFDGPLIGLHRREEGFVASLSWKHQAAPVAEPGKRTRLDDLADLGWQVRIPLRNIAHGRLDTPSADALATGVVAAMRGVFGVIHPIFLARR